MWSVRTEVIPVTTVAPVIVSKPLRKYLSNTTVKRDIKELQKTALLGTAQILQKVEENQSHYRPEETFRVSRG